MLRLFSAVSQPALAAADVALLLDWMAVRGQAARVLPSQAIAVSTADSHAQTLLALGEPPVCSPLAYDRAVVRLTIDHMQRRADIVDRQVRRSLQPHNRTVAQLQPEPYTTRACPSQTDPLQLTEWLT